MFNWAIFGTMTNTLDPMVASAVSQINGNLMPYAVSGFKLGLALWVAYLCFRSMMGHGSLWGLIVKLAGAAAVSCFMNLSTYSQAVTNIFLTDLPNIITNAIAGGPVTGNSFDTLFGQAFVSGLKIWHGLSAWSITDYGTMLLVVVFWLVVAVSECFAYVIWLMSKELLALLIAVGPIPFVCFLFPPVRAIFERWVGAVLSCIILQALLAAFLGILIKVETNMLASMSTSVTAGGIAQIPLLIGVCLVFVVAALLAHQLPGAATGLSGGLHFHAASVARAVYTPIARAGQAAHGALPNPAQATLSGAGAIRRSVSPGTSLSTTKAARP